MQRKFVVLSFVFFLITSGARFVASQDSPTQVPGIIRTVTLATPRGEIKISLPDDIRAGDTISGTVSAEPKGKDEKEKQKNAGELNSLVIEINTQRWPVLNGAITKLLIPAATIESLQISLVDAKGKRLDTSPLRVAPYSNVQPRPSFETPALGQSGRPLQINGPFDGDSSNTKIQIAGSEAKWIIESPRGAIVQIPPNVVGPSNININDNANTESSNFRALRIDLSAPKTSLRKGETTELQVQVQGLQGITTPVPIQIQNQTPSTINLTGGNTQNIVIQPSQVSSNGTFNWSTGITGTGTGGFNITGTIPAQTQTAGSQPMPTAAPQPTRQITNLPNQPQVVLTAAELEDRCKKLKEQIAEEKKGCKPCDELKRKSDQAAAAAQQAQADLDKANTAFNNATQSLLNQIKKAATDQKADWIFSLTAPPQGEANKWFPVQFDGGVVIWVSFPKATADDIAMFRSKIEESIRGVPSDQKGKLKALAAGVKAAEARNQQAQAALTAAQKAYDDCVNKNARACAEAERLQREYDECKKQAAAQTDAERKQKEKEEADKRAAEEARRIADEAERKRKADEGKSNAEAARKAEDARRMARERAEKQKLCKRCLNLFLDEAINQANLTAEQKNQIEQFLNSLDDLNGKLQNIQSVADLIPQLSQLSDLLGKLNVGADVINRVNTAINQIKQLASGGNGPEQLGTAIQLAAGALDAAAQAIPLLGPLAAYFKTLADAVSASIAAAYALRDMEGMKNGMGQIDDWSKSCQVAALYASFDGDLDKVYGRIFSESDRKTVMRETPEMKERLKQYLLAKIKECCLKMLKTQCPVLR